MRRFALGPCHELPLQLLSILKTGSHINAHHGVTNVRLVMHLPLVVPRDCALNLVDHGETPWKEGRLVMFDDTYLHGAWNRSDATRIVLLMDCWNPHPTAVERHAVQQLLEAISGLHVADRTPKRAAIGQIHARHDAVVADSQRHSPQIVGNSPYGTRSTPTTSRAGRCRLPPHTRMARGIADGHSVPCSKPSHREPRDAQGIP